MLVRLLLTVLFALAVAAPGGAQVEYARELPTEEGFAEVVRKMRAGVEDGFAQLRGERRDDTHWIPVCPPGLTPDLSQEPGEERYRIFGSKRTGRFFLTLVFESTLAPSDAEVEAFEANFKTLTLQLFAAAGEWDFSTSKTKGNTRVAELTGPDSISKVRLLLNRELIGEQRGRWSLALVGIAPYVDVEPMETAASKRPAFRIPRPTQAGFEAVIEAMKAGAYNGLEPLKGLLAPRRNWDKNGGFPTWGILPMEGLESDPQGELHSMVHYGRTDSDNGLSYAHYALGGGAGPTAEQAAALEAQFEELRGWLARHTQGWGTAEDFRPWSGLAAESRRFALVPLPGTEIFRVDGSPVPRIELWLRKRPFDEDGESGETWSLDLTCDAQGVPDHEDGTSEWVYELLSETEPAVELPATPANFEQLIQALVADAPNSFSNFCAPGEATAIDLEKHTRRIDDPIHITSQPRRPMTLHLTDAPDPEGVRDVVSTYESRVSSEAMASMSFISVRDPNKLTRRAVDQRLEQLVERLAAAFPGWLSSISDLPGGKEDFNVRLGLLKGLRPDGHPVWIGVERMRYPVRVPGYPDRDTLQLVVYVSTDHNATVGYDLLGQWREAKADGKEPITSAARIFGDPLEGKLLETDRVKPPSTGPINLVELFGIHGEDELPLVIVRDGHYEQLSLTLPRIDLARWRELQAQYDRGELPSSALALAGSRLATGELVELVRQLVRAGESDFAELPPAYAEWLVRTEDRELATVALPLWSAVEAPTAEFIGTWRDGLASTFDGKWIVEPNSRNSGPFWDWYARQTHWSARHEGPEGVHPWVELVQAVREDRIVVELQVHAFSEAHRLANIETPERLWFQPIGGDCVDGHGVAYCYREGLSFDGPFKDGLADGTGEHIFADGTALVDVRYEHGRMRYRGHVKPPPPPVTVYYDVSDDYAYDLRADAVQSDWTSQWGFDPGLIDPVPSPTDWNSGGWRYVTCAGCNGFGEQWYSYEVEDYDNTLVLYGTGLWNQGYDTIRTSYGTRKVNELGPCSSCNGTGQQHY